MTIYICKVFTPEFKAKIDNYINESINNWLVSEGKDIEEERKSYSAIFRRLELRDSITFLLNNSECRTTIGHDSKAYYESVGIWEPEYTTIELEAQERGYQSQPRVLWNGEIKKIDEIDEIFSFTCK